jgi:hypothetical protein
VYRLSFLVQAERERLRIWALLVVALCAVLVSGATPAVARAHSPKCRGGTVQIKVGKKATCVSRKVVLPPPSKTNSLVAGVQGALTFTELGFKTQSGKRVQSFSQKLGPSWTVAQGKLEGALAAMLAQVQKTARRPLAEIAIASEDRLQGCAAADVADDYGSDPGGNTIKANSTVSTNGVDVTMGLDSGGAHIGMNMTLKGDTYKMRYDSGEFSCLAYKLPPCPNGDGSLDADGLKGKTGFSLTVSRAGKVLKRESYTKTITVDTKGQLADDAKLDTVDVTYGETTNVVLDSTRLTQYGNRTTRIDMRTGRYDPGESVSFGSASVGGDFANVVGVEADAKDFAAFVSETISAYRSREKAWQTPNTCAKLKFNPGSGTLTLGPGDTGSFSSEVDAVADGARAAKASWTLGGQQNGSFSPAGSKDSQPSFSYEVSGNPGGDTLSVVVKATSTAGVAEDTWSQKLTAIRTISGTFRGHEIEEDRVSFDWSGTATFTLVLAATGGNIFTLTSGHATVTVSGTGLDGCTHSGTEAIPLAAQGVMIVVGTVKPYKYGFIAPWDNTYNGGGVTKSCPEQPPEPTTEIPTAAALQSGEVGILAAINPSDLNPSGLVQTSADGITFDGSATENDNVVGSASWNWSLKGSP